MTAKLKKCKVCGADMAASAKHCPQCGAKSKKPFYKKWWFWLIVALVAIGTAGGSSVESDTPQEAVSATVSTPQEKPAAESKPAEKPAEISYTHYNVTELFDALSGNALKAEKTFQDQYVEIEGYLSVIDSDGSYISVGAHPDDYDYFLQGVQCYVKKNAALLDQIMEMNIDDPIVVRGKITDIGEVLGYQMDMDSIS